MTELDSAIFRAVEREFYSFSFNLHRLQALEDRRENLAVLRSPSDFSERVDTGGSYASPIWQYLERAEKLDEEIAKHRLQVCPIQHMLNHLAESVPELERLFVLRYRGRLPWGDVEHRLGVSERTRKRMRRSLVSCGARFLGFLP